MVQSVGGLRLQHGIHALLDPFAVVGDVCSAMVDQACQVSEGIDVGEEV